MGESVKYVKITSKDKNGKKINPVIEIDQAKIDEDLKYAGYNLMVISEVDMDPLQIYRTYHNLWKIEESFRITKSYLDARPVYLQKKETIYGHFLICYLSLFLLRVLEIKVFKNKINSYELIDFMRDFRIVSKGDGFYINISGDQAVNEKVKKLTGTVPVLMEVKEFKDATGNVLYLTVSLHEIKEADIVVHTRNPQSGKTSYTPSASTHKIADIFKNVNLEDTVLLRFEDKPKKSVSPKISPSL